MHKLEAAVNGLHRWLLRQRWFSSRVLPLLPRPARWILRRIYFLPSDLVDAILGRREEMVPPKGRNFTGSVGNFTGSGQELVARLVDMAGLTPDSVILDVGSGMGRLAAALTPYLEGSGRYEGLDVVRSGIEWSDEHIAARFPRFRFTFADIHNKEYNPGGRLKASDYRFPYADGTFDLVVLTSVFTHMLPADTDRYVSEISRVLKEGGRCYATYNLVDGQSLNAMEAGRSALRLRRHAACWVVDESVPELAVGHDVDFVRSLYARNGLAGDCSIHHGTWSGRSHAPGQEPPYSQDIIVSAKRGPACAVDLDMADDDRSFDAAALAPVPAVASA